MTTLTRNILIGSGIVALGVTVYLLFRKFGKTKSSSDMQPKINDNHRNDLSNGIIVSIPSTKYGKYDVLIIWGGISYATPDWIYSQIPKDILYRYIVVIAPYNVKLSTVESVYKPFLESNHYNENTINTVSLLGFSAGALQVQENYSPKYKMVGLIDPSTKSNYVNIPFSKNTFIVFNDKNWTGSEGLVAIGKTLPLLGDSISRSGGVSERLNMKHADIPKYFFNKFLVS